MKRYKARGATNSEDKKFLSFWGKWMYNKVLTNQDLEETNYG